ncbi:MAG: hypothetical protein DRI71_10380 [Bacteroidetes bacterium]|nr:MAG: hypothetical protein DRI71_10380 [Bacteroidota bacterium]
MKNWLIAILLLPTLSFAQPFGNEWIDFNKDYYKISVAEDGIYKVTYQDLINVGFPIGTNVPVVDQINPKYIQLFHRGVEVDILIEGEDDFVFNPGDFIEFYGQKNDGTLDNELYVTPAAQPHKFYNLYSDTSAYFLTYNLLATNGKRMASQPPFTGVPKDNYYTKEIIQVNSDDYVKGVTISSYTSLTQFDIGEGFTGPRITEVAKPVYDITLNNLDLPVTTGPRPGLELLLVGRNVANHEIEVFLGPNISGLSSLGTYSFDGFNTLKIPASVDWNMISPTGSLLVRIEVITNGGIQSNLSVSYLTLNYPRQTDLLNSDFSEVYLKVQPSGGNMAEFLNTPVGSKAYDITDPVNVQKIINTGVSTTSITVGFRDASVARKLAIGTAITSFTIKKLAKFRKLDAALHDYLIISNKVLMQPSGGDAVTAYAAYRASVAGGSYDTLVMDIDNLYNQFSYGEVTPLAIYNFMEYMVVKGDPRHLLLIGKALDVSYKYYRDPSSPNLKGYHDLVPTAGSPGSDLAFTVGLNGTTYENAVPTGRLSVSTPQQIINYLNKVVEMEATPYDQLWRKNLLHLSGGNSNSELKTFKSYVDGFKAVAEDYYLGGNVTTVSKATTAETEFINVSEEVNKGLNLITFFGHSSPHVTDIDIGFVSDPLNEYDNRGKYPMIVMNGCNTGNIYHPNFIFGEDWIATADKGSTAVIAHTSFGFPDALRNWTDNFYVLAYSDSVFMEKTVGEIQVEVGKRLLALSGPNPSYKEITQIQQMGLQGDPAVKVFGTYLPDYEINKNSSEFISLSPLGVTAEADSFGLALQVRNFGAYINDSLEVFINRRLQDNTSVPYATISFPPVKNLDTVLYIIDNNIRDNAGLNYFDVSLDPANKITEHDEFNNDYSYDKFIPRSGTINLAPLNFSIHPTQSVDLVAQSGDPLAISREYLFEIDSSHSYQSPVMGSMPQTSTLITEWSGVNLESVDSIAYYWRTKYASPDPNETKDWTETSFTFIDGGDPGWAQVEYHQMDNNGMQGLEAREGTRTIDFPETTLAIEVVVHGASSVNTYDATELIIDGLPFILPPAFSLCSNNRLNIVAFNQENAAPYAPVPGNQVEKWTCGRSPQVINSYPAGKTLDEILEAVTPGDKVLLFTTGSFDFNTLTASTIAKLEELGADATVLAAKLPGEPYIMLGFKGAGSGNSTAEIIADPASATPTDEQSLNYAGDIIGIYANGELTSPDIGPALSWAKLSLQVDAVDPSDVYGVDVIGKNFSGVESVLFSNIQAGQFELLSINAEVYPLMKLKLKVEDDISRTAPQLDKWIVNYELPAEAYITYLDNSEGGSLSLTMQEGQDITTTFGFVNITDKEFTDSLKVTATFFNQDQRTSIDTVFNIGPPVPNDTTKFDIPFKTRGRVGVNNLEVAVNTLIQAEQIYQNNNISLVDYLTVVRDAANPLLEVSFDGEYIFDGDIVSPSPNIHITIRDENPYLFKMDTTGIDIFIKRPCEGCGSERIALAGNNIGWTPQTDREPFAIDYNPQNLEDGVYELSVQVEDASGNKSGLEPYVIHFEVINKSTITNFYPYPNPFSTSVRFVFTLTGSEIPDQIMIRIFTVSGRVVREITQDELGPLRIGNNATDYAWDGHDEFGDQLANGVYLYKVFIKKDGQNIELRESAGDRGFKNGYGKLYLLR